MKEWYSPVFFLCQKSFDLLSEGSEFLYVRAVYMANERFVQSSISSLAFTGQRGIAKNGFLCSARKQTYFCNFYLYLFHTSLLMKVHFKGLTKIKLAPKIVIYLT